MDLNIPNHIVIIPDGNRRWAKSKGLPTLEGHNKGHEAIVKVMQKARDLGIHTASVWGFSTENWNRDDKEVAYLMNLFEEATDAYIKDAHKNKIRIYHLGRKDRLSESLLKKLLTAEQETAQYTDHVFNLCLDYGGQEEILSMIEKICRDVDAGKILIEDIRKEVGKYQEKYPYYLAKNYLYTKDQPYPYPDLVIRTSGENRLSGFMPWQTCYSEIYFTEKTMPEFGEEELMKAIEDYSKRERRFGGDSSAIKS